MIRLAYTISPAAHYDACVTLPPSDIACPETDQPVDIPLESDQQNLSHDEGPASTTNTTAENSPRKSASFMTPPKRKRNRKRKATPENWKKNIRKRLQLTGQEYVNQKGETVKGKHVKAKDCSKCRYRCSSKNTVRKGRNCFVHFGIWVRMNAKKILFVHV